MSVPLAPLLPSLAFGNSPRNSVPVFFFLTAQKCLPWSDSLPNQKQCVSTSLFSDRVNFSENHQLRSHSSDSRQYLLQMKQWDCNHHRGLVKKIFPFTTSSFFLFLTACHPENLCTHIDAHYIIFFIAKYEPIKQYK